MKIRVLSILLSLAALQWVGSLQAQNVPAKDLKADKSDEIRRSAVEAHHELARQFADFQKQLQVLKNRLDRSPNVEDKDRSAQLQKVLDYADGVGIRVKFARLQDLLRKPKFTLDDYKEAAIQNEILAKDLANLVNLLDHRSNNLGDEIKSTKDAIEKLKKIIADQQDIQLKTELGKGDKNRIIDEQQNVKKDTTGLKNDITGKKDSKDLKTPPTGGEAKDMKSQPKEGKGGDKSETKDAGKKNQGEAKDNPKDANGKDKKPAEAKGADPKEAKPGAPDAKPGEKKDGSKGSENKDASAKDSKGSKSPQGEAKDSKGKEGKQGDSKDAGKKDGAQPKGKETGEAKGVEKKEEPKNADNKPAESKAKDKGEENKAGAKDSKSSPDAKPSDSKDAGKDSKPAEAKSGDPKPGQKSNAKPSPSQGEPKDGDSPPQAKGDKTPPPPPQAGNDKESPIGKKQIQDAIDKMKDAVDKLKKDNMDDAGKDQGDAIKLLKDAKKELEKRLKILREEELERLIANLKARCERMRAMQIDVLSNQVDGTEATFRAIQGNSDKKPTDVNFQASLRLAAKEKEIIIEATKAIEILEGEGSAVAFPVAFEQVREDMKQVHRRLDLTDVGPITQAIERDIIASLTDMIDALKKKEDDMKKDKEKPKPPSPPKDTDSGPPPDQKLLDQIAELKMIRSMQVRLNQRTKTYADLFPNQEQPTDPVIRSEVMQLRDRQERIFDITNKIQKGDNK